MLTCTTIFDWIYLFSVGIFGSAVKLIARKFWLVSVCWVWVFILESSHSVQLNGMEQYPVLWLGLKKLAVF